MLSVSYVKNPDVVLREEGEDGVLLFNPDTGQVFLLNATALFVWNSCDGSNSVAAILENIRESYEDVPEGQVENDLMTLIQELVRAGYLGVEHEFIARRVTL